jgi:hypothetical protein
MNLFSLIETDITCQASVIGQLVTLALFKV